MSISTITTDNEFTLMSHPGTILKTEFLEPMEITQYKLSKGTGISESHLSKIVRGEGRITADTALLLGRYFGISADFWMELQKEYDLFHARRRVDFSKVYPLRSA